MKIFRLIGSFIFWNYPRGSRQYDVMVALILAFVFLTPRHVFQERTSPAQAGQISEVREAGVTGYRIEAGLLRGSERSLEVSAEHILEGVTKRKVDVERVQPVVDKTGRVEAYIVWTHNKD